MVAKVESCANKSATSVGNQFDFKSCMLQCLRVPFRPLALSAVKRMTKRDIKRARIDAFFKRVDLPQGEKQPVRDDDTLPCSLSLRDVESWVSGWAPLAPC